MDSPTLLHVLLLEDSPLDADLIVDWLNGDGFDCRVQRAQTRDEFTSALCDNQFDIVLADYSLPGFDGISALRITQELRPQLPFIIVSGHLGEELAIDTLKQGATDYVLKGRLQRLSPAVNRALREVKERVERQRIETVLRTLSEASLVLSSLDYTTTLQHVARLAVPHFADYCLVDVVESDGFPGGRLHAAPSDVSVKRVAVAHANEALQPLADQLLRYTFALQSGQPLCKVIESGQSQLLAGVDASFIEENAREEQHRQILRELGAASCMMIPLLSEGQVLGVMTFVSSKSGRRFNTLDVSLAEDLARRCALAIDKARLHRKTLESLRARDEFLAVLSHELRSPLTAILGWIHLLNNGDIDRETLARGLQVIERNARMQKQLIDDLLEVSRVITGRLHLELQPVTLRDIAQNTLNSLKPTWEAKNLHVEFVDQATSSLVMGDGPRLQQILYNLIANAIKFTPQGGHIEIALTNQKNYVGLVVKDTGEGIAREFLPYVFDRFQQADSSTTRRHGGLGLGLAIVRHLTEMHGGTIHADSPGHGHGATFTFCLPLLGTVPSVSDGQTIGATPPAQSDNEISDSLMLSNLRVLLVEDGDDMRDMIATILRGSGAQVTSVDSVEAAIAALEINVPDVLLSDIGMPGADGYALMRHVKVWEEKNQRRIPALALTAYAGEEDRARTCAAGFLAHLAKPVEPDHLVNAVANLARNPQKPLL
jgi:signal transduction histidine kinase/DNA-binding response OmpR family regulator